MKRIMILVALTLTLGLALAQEVVLNDGNANSYAAGYFVGMRQFGEITLTAPKNAYWGYVAKMDPDGNWLWAKAIESSYVSAVNGLAVGDGVYAAGSIYLYRRSNDGLLVKYDEDGKLLWQTQFGGGLSDWCAGVSAANGKVWAVGSVGVGKKVPLQFGTITQAAPTSKYANMQAGFIAQLDPDGNWLWVKRLPNNGAAQVLFVVADGDCAYVAGQYTQYNQTQMILGDSKLPFRGGIDAFIGKIDAKGNWLWATALAGSGADYIYSIDLQDGVLQIAGETGGMVVDGVAYPAGAYNLKMATDKD